MTKQNMCLLIQLRFVFFQKFLITNEGDKKSALIHHYSATPTIPFNDRYAVFNL